MPKDLMDKTTNQIIHEWLGKCWHNTVADPSGFGRRCAVCRMTFWDDQKILPDYENDLNAVREAELKAIEEFGELMYWDELERGLEHPTTVNAITAPASVRAEAIRNLVEEK